MSLNIDRASLNRREILFYFFLSCLLMLGVFLGLITVVYAMPKATYINIGHLTDFPPVSRPYRIQSKRGSVFWLVNLGSEIRAFKPDSPDHSHCRFVWSEVMTRFEDPCSGSKFALDGVYVQGLALRNLDQYPVRMWNEQIQVELSRIIPGEEITRQYLKSISRCGYRVYGAVSDREPSVGPGKILVSVPVYCP